MSSLTALVGWCGACVGAASVLWWCRRGFSKRGLTTAVGLGYLSYLVADGLTPLAIAAAHSFLRPDSGLNPAQSAAIPWLPADPPPTLVALGASLARLLRFVPLGFFLRFAVRRVRGRYLATTMVLAFVIGLGSFARHHTPWSGILTEVLLAGAGIFLGVLASERIVRYRTGAPASEAPSPAHGPSHID